MKRLLSTRVIVIGAALLLGLLLVPRLFPGATEEPLRFGPLPEGMSLSVRTVATFTTDDLFDFSTGERKNVHSILPSDLEFFPDGSGESLLTSATGTVVWLDREMAIKGQFQTASANSLKNHLVSGGPYDNEGLLGLAFDPDFKRNRYLYVHLNELPRQGVFVYRLTWNPEDLAAVWGSRELMFSAEKTQVATSEEHLHNHNGGNPAFGPDGKLYIFVGDGGIGGFDFDNSESQRLDSYWGKVIRLDPHRPGEPEIIARGLRNPFTHSWFGNALLLGDVGFEYADDWEEVNLLELDSYNGTDPVNFGWHFFSGPCPAGRASGCAGFVDPILGYAKADSTFMREDPQGNPPPPGVVNRSSVIIGPVYQGARYRGYLDNVLIYTDLLQGWIRGALLSESGQVVEDRHLMHYAPRFVTGFTTGPDGFLYMTSGYGKSASISRIEGPATAVSPAADERDGRLVDNRNGRLPPVLAQTGIFHVIAEADPEGNVWHYEPAFPRWKNGTAADRYLLLPKGASIDTSAARQWRFPPGTVLVKNLSAPNADEAAGAPIETQILYKAEEGWQAGAYLWRERGDDVELVVDRSVTRQLSLAGELKNYTVLTGGQCLACHATAPDQVLGLTPAQLSQGQLDELYARGLLSHPVQSLRPDPAVLATVAGRASAYLHGNCAFCHSAGGQGAGLGFDLSFEHMAELVGTRSRRNGLPLIVPGRAQQSPLYRMLAWQPGVAPMPPLGRDFPDPDGSALVARWINALRDTATTETTTGTVKDTSVTPTAGSITLRGLIQTEGGIPICGLVRAAGKFTYSCRPVGEFSLTDLMPDENGIVRREIYALGFFPKVDVRATSSDELVIMKSAEQCRDYNEVPEAQRLPAAAGKRLRISGRVLAGEGDEPVCALVLANGRRVDACDGTFSTELPMDEDGRYTLHVYAAGYAPASVTLDASVAESEVRVTPAAECR